MTDTVTDGTTESLDEQQLLRMRKLRRILRFLAEDERLAHMDERIRIFGSAAAGKPCPGDIDAYFDFSDCRESLSHPSVIQNANLLLSVAGQFYGLFDPFVRVGKILYTRNDNCNGWVYAKKVREIRKAGEEGRTPADVYHEMLSRPPGMGGAPVPTEAVAAEASPTP